MGRAKEIIVKVIPAKIANEFIIKNHYSGKKVNNSSLHFGCFLDNGLHGVLSFGCPLDKSKVINLVKPCLWNEMLELNRMVFTEILPKYSESRCIAIAIKLIKINAPHIKFILSYSDATHSGDGTIYRASGFVLTGFSKASMIELPERLWKYNGGGHYAHRITLQAKSNIMYRVIQKELNLNGAYKTMEYYAKALGTKIIEGFQLRYIYLIDKICKITVPILPFSKIDELGAGMYLGKKITQAERHKNAILVQGSTTDIQSVDGTRSDRIAL
jgi:hypothetical protein